MNYIRNIKEANKHDFKNFEVEQLNNCQAVILKDRRDGIEVFISYYTVIGIKYHDVLFITNSSYSVTTSRQTTWYKRGAYYLKEIETAPEDLQTLYRQLLKDDLTNFYGSINFLINRYNNLNKYIGAAYYLEDLINKIDYSYTSYNHVCLFKEAAGLKEGAGLEVQTNIKELKTRWKVIKTFNLNNYLSFQLIETKNKSFKKNIKLEVKNIKINKAAVL